MLAMVRSCGAIIQRLLTSRNAEHRADSKLLQPDEQVVADFDGHVDRELKVSISSIDLLSF